jgi:hypothetical protein
VRALLALVVVAGCSSPVQHDVMGNRFPGQGSGAPLECTIDDDCEAVGLKCCDCPTYAIPSTDLAPKACTAVMCPSMTCPDNVRAACDAGLCVLACAPLACSLTCADGYVIDANGCAECQCAAVADGGCSHDSDCVRTRADCCGCAGGGVDTAMPVAEQASYDASLMCPPDPACSGTDTCAADLAPACVEGSCNLVSPLPSNACGRPDLPTCPPGQTCTLNSGDVATTHGVGVCM